MVILSSCLQFPFCGHYLHMVINLAGGVCVVVAAADISAFENFRLDEIYILQWNSKKLRLQDSMTMQFDSKFFIEVFRLQKISVLLVL